LNLHVSIGEIFFSYFRGGPVKIGASQGVFMKKLIATLLALGSITAFAQSETEHSFPRKLSDLSKKTNITKSSSLGVLSRLVLLNSVSGPVVLRVCVTRPDFESSTYLNAKLDDRETSIVDEYIGTYAVIQTIK
jgi:hypothetical protein